MLRGHHRITNWPNFNSVSQEIGRPEDRERKERENRVGRAARHTQHFLIKSSSYMGVVCGAPKQF